MQIERPHSADSIVELVEVWTIHPQRFAGLEGYIMGSTGWQYASDGEVRVARVHCRAASS